MDSTAKQTAGSAAAAGNETVWRTRGFESFREGTFGNAGHNLYVSRGGVLQRIHRFDVNRDGYFDLMFCNAQEHLECPPVYVYHDPLGEARRVELPSEGSGSGAVGNINGDQYDDLLLAMEKSGNAGLFNAFVYYGSPKGLGEHAMNRVPAHKATSAAIGDFNGNGRGDLALITEGKLRIFYHSEIGIEPKTFTDLDIHPEQIGAADVDGDGCADLVAFLSDGTPLIYWGDADGIDPQRCTKVTIGDKTDIWLAAEDAEVSEEERVAAVSPLAKVITLAGVPHLFIPFTGRAYLLPVNRDRTFGKPLVFGCRKAVSVAAGDITGNGHTDLVFVGRDRNGDQECSWIYWGAADGFSEDRRTAVPTLQACDVAVGDLNGSGCDDVAICQKQSDLSFTVESVIYRGGPDGVDANPVCLETLGARRVFIVRTCDEVNPQVIFVNQKARSVLGDVDSHIYFGGPDGFSPDRVTKLSGRGATSAVISDFTDDGWPDVFLANSSENAIYADPGSYLFFGGPDGLPYEPDVVFPTRKAWSVACADLNRNGYLDLIVAPFHDPTIEIFRGGPDGFDMENPERISVKEGTDDFRLTRRICLADLNNDGWLDLIMGTAGSCRCAILWGGPDGFQSERRQVLPTMWLGGPAMARDITGNGYADLIIGGGKPRATEPHESFVQIFWNGPEGLRVDRQTQLPCNASVEVAVADFNNDGHPDIFCCCYKSTIERDIDSYIYWGGPDGQYSAWNRTALRTHSSAGCIAADFNEDGYVDLAVANHKTYGDHTGDSFVFWNGPDGFDMENITRLPNSGPHGTLLVRPGNVMDGGDDEYYISVPHELPDGTAVTQVAWEAELLPKTWVRAQLRTAGSAQDLDQAPWCGPDGEGTWFDDGRQVDGKAAAGQWVQYRLALGSVNGASTPRLTEVSVFYE